MGELWEESDCGLSEGELPRIRSEEDANQRITKSGRESEGIYSSEGSARTWSRNEPIHKYEDPEDWLCQHG